MYTVLARSMADQSELAQNTQFLGTLQKEEGGIEYHRPKREDVKVYWHTIGVVVGEDDIAEEGVERKVGECKILRTFPSPSFHFPRFCRKGVNN